MNCPRCQHDTPAGVKFCGECGVRLGSACAACGATNPPGSKFCGQCGSSLVQGATIAKFASPEAHTPKHPGEKILTRKHALEVERKRKQVTALFASTKGSMELLADRDPEDARKLLDAVIEHTTESPCKPAAFLKLSTRRLIRVHTLLQRKRAVAADP